MTASGKLHDLGPNRRLIGKSGSRRDLAAPCLVLATGALKHTVATAAAFWRTSNIALRPHAKTHKCATIAALQIAAGSEEAAWRV